MLYSKSVQTRGSRPPDPHRPPQRGPPREARPPLNVQRAIRRPHVADSDEQDVDQRPDPQAAEAEELAEAFSPLAQVEAVCAKATEGDAATGDRAGTLQVAPAAAAVAPRHRSAASGRGRESPYPLVRTRLVHVSQHRVRTSRPGWDSANGGLTLATGGPRAVQGPSAPPRRTAALLTGTTATTATVRQRVQEMRAIFS